MTVDSGVKLFDDETCQRAHDHGTQEHGVRRAGDDADCCDGAHDGTAKAADNLAALEGDE